MLTGSTKLQRDISVRTIQSKATADTLDGSLIAPPFRFGMQKQYRLNDMDSRRGERKKAETTLKEGQAGASSQAEISQAATMAKSPSVAAATEAKK